MSKLYKLILPVIALFSACASPTKLTPPPLRPLPSHCLPSYCPHWWTKELASATAISSAAGSDLVLIGKVISTGSLEDTAEIGNLHQPSEHDVHWALAVVEVKKWIFSEGRLSPREYVLVMFPSSYDSMWRQTPRPVKGAEALFMLRINTDWSDLDKTYTIQGKPVMLFTALGRADIATDKKIQKIVIQHFDHYLQNLMR